MILPRLPMTVIGGYLGAGKTTLINRLLRENHGQRVLVMVNDFGAVNIDADLLQSADEDTMTLTNGCVCCTMGADLFMAIGDALDRRPRPDHLVIEASGIANPAKIAEAARTQRDLAYGGVVGVVDAENFAALAGDPLIGAQIRDQVSVSDLLLVSKASEGVSPALSIQLATLSAAPVIDLNAVDAVAPLVLREVDSADFCVDGGRDVRAHPTYASWSHEGDDTYTRANLEAKLLASPSALYRIKGVIRGAGDEGFEIHKVGRSIEILRIDQPQKTRLVGIGPQGGISAPDIQAWWENG